MLGPEVNNEGTILDYLNEDCWRAVLRHVPARDLIRTQRASRRWQEVILSHLRGVHITIGQWNEDMEKIYHPNVCWARLSEGTLQSFEDWTKKLGTTVVEAYCNSAKSLSILSANCPNIKSLQLINLECAAHDTYPLPDNLHETFKLLQRVYFYSCHWSDPMFTQILTNKALEQLELINCNNVTGTFFSTINLSNVKSLVLDKCRQLKPEYTLPIFNRLGMITKLQLSYLYFEVLEESQLVLDKMPELEWLALYDDDRMSCHSAEPLTRLPRLKYLSVSYQLSDDDVEAVTRSCQDLQDLQFHDCQGMTCEVVAPLCRYASRLTSLSLGRFYECNDDAIVTLIRGLPRLTSLDIGGCHDVTPLLPARAAAARDAALAEAEAEAGAGAGRLRLDLTATSLGDDGEELEEEYKEQYKNMKTEFENLIVIV